MWRDAALFMHIHDIHADLKLVREALGDYDMWPSDELLKQPPEMHATNLEALRMEVACIPFLHITRCVLDQDFANETWLLLYSMHHGLQLPSCSLGEAYELCSHGAGGDDRGSEHSTTS